MNTAIAAFRRVAGLKKIGSMGLLKTKGKTMAQSSRSRSGRGGPAGGAWKKSPLVMGLLIAVIVVVWGMTLFGDGNDSEKYVLKDLEYIYISQNAPLEDAIAYPQTVIKKYDNNKQPRIPFEDPAGSGNWMWEAYQCNNDACAYFVQKQQRFVFSNFNEDYFEWAKDGFPEPKMEPGPDGRPVDMEEMMRTQALRSSLTSSLRCPICDSTTGMPERYQTPETARRVKENIELIMEENATPEERAARKKAAEAAAKAEPKAEE